MGTIAHHRAQARHSLHRARDPTAGPPNHLQSDPADRPAGAAPHCRLSAGAAVRAIAGRLRFAGSGSPAMDRNERLTCTRQGWPAGQPASPRSNSQASTSASPITTTPMTASVSGPVSARRIPPATPVPQPRPRRPGPAGAAAARQWRKHKPPAGSSPPAQWCRRSRRRRKSAAAPPVSPR